jgi:hypothetical protein
MYIGDTGLSLASKDPGIPFIGKPGAEKDKKRWVLAPVTVYGGESKDGAGEHGGIIPDHVFRFPFAHGIWIAGVRGTLFIEQVVRILIEFAGSQGAGENEALDVEVLCQF